MSKDEVLYDADEHGELLTPEAAIERLRKQHAIKLGLQRLADLRSAGGGPRFIKPTLREVRYPTAMLDEWAEARNRKPLLDFVPMRPPKDPSTNAQGAVEADAESLSGRLSEHGGAEGGATEITEEQRRLLALSPTWRR